MRDHQKPSHTKKLPTEELAGLIVDALITGDVVSKSSYERAMAIVIEEIDVRKALGDY